MNDESMISDNAQNLGRRIHSKVPVVTLKSFAHWNRYGKEDTVLKGNTPIKCQHSKLNNLMQVHSAD